MKLSLGINIDSLKAQRRLADNSNNLSKAFERLSSGLRINRAADDAAGLALATSLNSDARVFAQAIRNVNDGISALNIADGALQELSNITMRLSELSQQASNGTYKLPQRTALTLEANALVDEYNRIVESAEFNGRKLLQTAGTQLSIQAGRGSNSSINFSLGNDLSQLIGTGSFTDAGNLTTTSNTQHATIADVNRDGIADIVGADSAAGRMLIYIGNGNGTFKAGVSYTMLDNIRYLATGDFNGDGALDVAAALPNFDGVSVSLGNGDGTFKTPTLFDTGGVGSRPLFVAVRDINGDGIQDLVTGNDTGTSVGVVLGNGNGSFKAATTYSAGGVQVNSVTFGDFNGDGVVDMAASGYSTDFIAVFMGNANGTFGTRTLYAAGDGPRRVVAGDVNFDGFLDLVSAVTDAGDCVEVLLGNGNGSFKAPTTYTAGDNPYGLQLQDLNGDGVLDIVTAEFNASTLNVYLGNEDGTFKAPVSFSAGGNSNTVTLGDLNGDGVLDAITSDFNGQTISIFLATTQESALLPRLNLFNRDDALASIDIISAARDRVTAEIANVGAQLSRLDVAVNNLYAARENYLAAASRIMDADVAEETAQMVRLQVLQQATAAVLAQANQTPALLLSLLKP